MQSIRIDLNPPSLDEAARAIEREAKAEWGVLSASVVDCPDLSGDPFHLAAPAFGPHSAILDIGGVSNLFPTVRRDKIYDIREICKSVGFSNGFVIGPGAGPFHIIGHNSEGMYNLNLAGANKSMYTEIVKETGSYATKPMPEDTTELGLMANLLLSDGAPSKVLKVEAQKRLTERNFTDSIRLALRRAFGEERHIALGGAFLINAGKANLHVMPEFPAGDTFESTEKLEKEWLRYFDMSAPLVALSVLHTGPSDKANLRVEHSHCFSQHGDGGHYHYDVTPDVVHYVAYYVLPSTIYSIN